MKIALFGASGMIGQRVTLEALVRGHEVQAITRNPAQFPIAHPRLRVVQATLLDLESVVEAITGYDVVVNATGPDLEASDEQKWAFYINSANTLIEGVKRANVSRVLVVGGAGSLEVAPGVRLLDTPDFPEFVLPIARPMAEALNIYRASEGVNWSFFCPSIVIAPGRRTGSYRTGTDRPLTNDQGESFISVEDYAFALLDELENPHFLRQRFTAVSLAK